MSRPASRSGVAVVLALALGCLTACSAAGTAPAAAPGTGVTSPSVPASPSAAPRPSFRSPRTLAAAAFPVRLRIPSLGVDAPVGRVGRAADGTVEVPRRWEDVGWFEQGARPGESGPAVLLGHVDSKSGPAVFVRLPRARAGTEVEVEGADGSVQRFRVRAVAQFPKVRFPTEAVYLPVLRPELRLVTCGGSFDRSTGHYRDNIVVSADLIT